MLDTENYNTEYKSLKLVLGPSANLKDLAETCVCLANAQGGIIYIGIENSTKLPPVNQKIVQEDVNSIVSRLRALTDSVGIANPEIVLHTNGGQYFKFSVLPSTRTIATTSSGKVLMRVTDKCYPVSSEELTTLAAEKNAFQWELISPSKTAIEQADKNQITKFLSDIRTSSKVSVFVKQKTDYEILEYYQLVNDGQLTNLGVLWLGTPAQRARLSYPITVQYIVYNSNEEKIRKEHWHSHEMNPKELLLDIEQKAIELNYTTEIPDGLYRKQIRNYPKEVIRELLVNCIAHKRFTMSGDIFIEVYPDRVSFSNPGGLPLGITKDNILHERHRRNPHFIQTLHDIGLMEGEGSGYDLVFEKLSRDGKPFPVIESSTNKVAVTVYSGIVDSEILLILDHVDKNFQLSQKEFIALGVIAAERKILPTQLSAKLQLQEERLRNWVGSLIEKGIVITRGFKKGTEYLLNPQLFASAKLGITPTLKTIEPYKLDALIQEDLKYNGESSISQMKTRIKDIDEADLRKAVYGLTKKGILEPKGSKKNRTYVLAKKK